MQAAVVHLQLPTVISAIGGLGIAAFGLLEAVKPACPLLNRIGFKFIRRTVVALTPAERGAGSPLNALPAAAVLHTLQANWENGVHLVDQKAIAKSLIKLHLSAANAAQVAAAANVDPEALTAVAASMASGAPLTEKESDVWSRFDLIVTAMLDESYQCADQVFRNAMRGLAAAIAVVLAIAGGWMVNSATVSFGAYLVSPDFGRALLVGLLATPLAPVAKDLSTALATAVNAMQLVKKP